MKLFVVSSVAAVVAVTFIPQSTSAQQYEYYPREAGPYFHVGVGPAFTQTGEITEFTGFAAGNKISYDTGFAGELGGGYAFNRYIALGAEGGWVGNEIKRVEGFALNDTFLYNAPILATLTLQCPIPNTIITPFVRAGVGGSVTIFDTDYFDNGAVALFGNDSDVVFAYQLSAGVRFNFNDQMSIGITYKYFATDDSDFSYEGFFGPDQHLGIEGVRSHLVTVSFNMMF
jgi:opacity protein-like surface antigen